jgi:hypothetical protein
MTYNYSLLFRRLVISVLLLLLGLVSIAQRTVTGKVVTAEGQPVAGATVTIKGTMKNALTTESGIYSIAAEETDVLIISSVGFANQEIAARDNAVITMVIDSRNLSEVVVTALGIKKEAWVRSAGSKRRGPGKSERA